MREGGERETNNLPPLTGTVKSRAIGLSITTCTDPVPSSSSKL